MSRIEIVMLCLSYALDRVPHMSEIRRAKDELLAVDPGSVSKVIKSAQFMYPYMTEKEIATFKEQLCTCMLSAVDYRITLAVMEYNPHGYALCPRCGTPLDRDYQAFCDHCGQHLKWGGQKYLRRADSK
ncbi:MAG: zinc ribbon domain-containing protein [Oscillospiraceae bacterium]|nr:zinc ribbon domain-containing protein [Oscillospiraceae bacterium]